MKTIPLRIIAFACLCLLTAPLSSFAQTDNTMPVISPDSSEVPTFGNEASPSLPYPLTRAILAVLSSAESFTGTESAYANEAGNSPDQALGGNAQDQTKPPASNPAAPSLQDLGFSLDQTKGNALEQARLDKRSHMLKIHQRLGLITTVPLLATLITSVNAGGKNTSSSSRDLHTALGAVTADLYFTTAYFAIRAPKIPGTETRGPIRLHKALAWIHGPGMILTPILGAMAFSQKSHGEKVHGIAAAHGPVAIVTAGAFAAAILSVSIKF